MQRMFLKSRFFWCSDDEWLLSERIKLLTIFFFFAYCFSHKWGSMMVCSIPQRWPAFFLWVPILTHQKSHKFFFLPPYHLFFLLLILPILLWAVCLFPSKKLGAMIHLERLACLPTNGVTPRTATICWGYCWMEDASDEGKGGEVTSNDLSAPLVQEEKEKYWWPKGQPPALFGNGS